MTTVEVRHLRAFLAVADERHFGRAAARLQLSPSPVSRTVSELEREFGVSLFVRHHHRVELTEAGDTLVIRARALLDSWEDFTIAGKGFRERPPVTRLRIGSPSLAPPAAVDRVVALIAEVEPDAIVDVEFGASAELVAAVRRGALDLTLAHLPLEGGDLRVLPVARYALDVVVVASDDPLALREQVEPSDLLGRRVLQLSAALQPATMDGLDQWLLKHGAIIEQLPEPDLARLAHLVKRGRGLTLGGRSGPTTRMFDQPGLTTVPLHRDAPHLELGVVWRREDEDLALISQLAQRLAQLTADELLTV